eukprot:4949163-Amphidinium_carterae.1
MYSQDYGGSVVRWCTDLKLILAPNLGQSQQHNVSRECSNAILNGVMRFTDMRQQTRQGSQMTSKSNKVNKGK